MLKYLSLFAAPPQHPLVIVSCTCSEGVVGLATGDLQYFMRNEMNRGHQHQHHRQRHGRGRGHRHHHHHHHHHQHQRLAPKPTTSKHVQATSLCDIAPRKKKKLLKRSSVVVFFNARYTMSTSLPGVSSDKAKLPTSTMSWNQFVKKCQRRNLYKGLLDSTNKIARQHLLEVSFQYCPGTKVSWWKSSFAGQEIQKHLQMKCWRKTQTGRNDSICDWCVRRCKTCT